VAECSSRPVWRCTEDCAPIGIRSPDHPAPRGSLYRLRYPSRHFYIFLKIVYNLGSHKIPNSYYSTHTAVKLVVDQSSRQRRTSLQSLLGHCDSVPSRVLLFGGAWSYFISCVMGNKNSLMFHNTPNFKLNYPTTIMWFNIKKIKNFINKFCLICNQLLLHTWLPSAWPFSIWCKILISQ